MVENQTCGDYDPVRQVKCKNNAQLARKEFAGTPLEYVCLDHYFIAERVK